MGNNAWWRRTLGKLRAIKRKTPLLRRLRLNFIFFHYSYIIAVAIVGSIILYPGGGLSYTDALLFATGSATQSGLNPVDINDLKLYQQIWLWFGSMISNPIVVHTSVVFIRLHWFEKRFEDIAREAKALRRSKSRARTLTGQRGTKDDRDLSRAEMGVRGRNIEVVRDSSGRALGHFLDPTRKVQESSSSPSSASNAGDPAANQERPNNAANPEEEDVPMASGQQNGGPAEPSRLPVPATDDHNISVLEKQRRQSGALRIPGPREYDKGGGPQAVDDTDGGGLMRKWTTRSDRSRQRQASMPPVPQHITFDEPDILRSRRQSTLPRADSHQRTAESGTAEQSELNPTQRTRSRRSTVGSFLRSLTEAQEHMPYLSWEPTMGRNSAFIGMTESQRDELGGIEYRALKTLAIILISYFIGFHVIGVVCLIPWIVETSTYGDIVRHFGQNRSWWAIFTSGSAFNDQGFTITPDSMASFYDAIFPLLLMAFLIVIGNAAFPCMLRFMIWVMWKLAPRKSVLWEELHFLLDHPRRCFTLLFPRAATWWLVGVVVSLNGLDLIFFVLLNVDNTDVKRIPGGIRFVDGLFQAASNRTAGFTVIGLGKVHPSLQVCYMIMMYIAVYPVAISLRRTNVYEERSIGIYSPPEDDEEEEQEHPEKRSYVGTHLRKQLGYDMWFIFLGLFLIAIIEGSHLGSDEDYKTDVFAILFEIISAFGTVGFSLGYPGVNVALCGEFRTLSKLIIIAMEIRGRHRGLPYDVDRAILLPSEALRQKEAADAEKRARRRSSVLSRPATNAVTGETPAGMVRSETGMSTARQQDGAPRSNNPDGVVSEMAETTPSPRLTFANNVRRLPTHQEQES